MTQIVTIDCPFCLTNSVAANVEGISFVRGYEVGDTKKFGANYEAAARCASCNSPVLVYLLVQGGYGPITEPQQFPLSGGNIARGRCSFVGQIPGRPKANVPKFLPENVERTFRDAEGARLQQLWTPAAMSYGKAVERAISPFIEDAGPRDTLGMKLGKLIGKGELPGQLTDWISVVLTDRNFATHEEHGDFSSESDIQIMRDLARILLQYLYTMPKQVELAKTAAEERASNG